MEALLFCSSEARSYDSGERSLMNCIYATNILILGVYHICRSSAAIIKNGILSKI